MQHTILNLVLNEENANLTTLPSIDEIEVVEFTLKWRLLYLQVSFTQVFD